MWDSVTKSMSEKVFVYEVFVYELYAVQYMESS